LRDFSQRQVETSLQVDFSFSFEDLFFDFENLKLNDFNRELIVLQLGIVKILLDSPLNLIFENSRGLREKKKFLISFFLTTYNSSLFLS
jgi:hypothetical protein